MNKYALKCKYARFSPHILMGQNLNIFGLRAMIFGPKDMLKHCWSQNPEERPSFDKIVNDLKNNEAFITESTDDGEFLDYVDFIDNYESTFGSLDQLIHLADFIKIRGRRKTNRRQTVQVKPTQMPVDQEKKARRNTLLKMETTDKSNDNDSEIEKNNKQIVKKAIKIKSR